MAKRHAIVDSEQSPVVLSCEGQERRGGERMAGVGGGWVGRCLMTLGEVHLPGLAFLPFQGAAEDQSKEFS